MFRLKLNANRLVARVTVRFNPTPSTGLHSLMIRNCGLKATCALFALRCCSVRYAVRIVQVLSNLLVVDSNNTRPTGGSDGAVVQLVWSDVKELIAVNYRLWRVLNASKRVAKKTICVRRHASGKGIDPI